MPGCALRSRIVTKKRSFLLLGALALVVGGGVILTETLLSAPTLALRELVVEGETDARAVADVRRAVESELTGSFFSQDIDKIRIAIERLTWVKKAMVSRVWPDALNVHIERHEPIARWEDGRLVSKAGVVYMPLVEEPEKTDALPLILADTPMFAPEVVQSLPRLQEVASSMQATLKTVSVSYRDSWSVELEFATGEPLSVELGRATNSDIVLERLRLVAKYFKQVCETMQARPTRIDARYEKAFAVRWPAQDRRDTKGGS